MDVLTIATIKDQSHNFWSYVIVGYGAAFLAVGGYSIRVILRGRRLSHKVPPDQRRWL